MLNEEFDALSVEEALTWIAHAIDRAADTVDAELNNLALDHSTRLLAGQHAKEAQRVLLHYYCANAYENRVDFAAARGAWDWDIPDLEAAFLELRRAIAHPAFDTIDSIPRCQILTNLGNKLSAVGRPVEALACWDRALMIQPNFAMAWGNRGFGLLRYARGLYDGGHSALLLAAAGRSWRRASVEDPLYDSVHSAEHAELFAKMADQIGGEIDLASAESILAKPFSLGRSRSERMFRQWSLSHRLFLNPLNDLGIGSIAANDVLHLPSLTVPVGPTRGGPPVVIAYYNLLKQEFVSARWLCFEGMNDSATHFSDAHTHLYDTFDWPSYALATEKTKQAFRMSYAIFDKIAYFIYVYFGLGIKERDVTFRHVWTLQQGKDRLLNTIFVQRENWALRGLYWLSKDLFEPAFKEAAAPDAELRNQLEHKFCHVIEDAHPETAIDVPRNAILRRSVLETKCLHMLGMARAALIYLSLAIHYEESAQQGAGSHNVLPSMSLTVWKPRKRL